MLKLKVFRSEGASAQSSIEQEANQWFAEHPDVAITQFGAGSSGPQGNGYTIAFLYEVKERQGWSGHDHLSAV